MRVAYVCTDPGIPIFGSKGASIHAQSVLTVLLRRGHEVHLVTVRPEGRPLPGVRVHGLPPVGKGAAADREQAAQRSDAAAAAALDDIAPDLVYERYSLWGRTATAWADLNAVPSVLEVNAPLIEEQVAYRELSDRTSAEAVVTSALSRASSVICVSEEVRRWAVAKSQRHQGLHVLPNGVDTERIQPSSRPVSRANSDSFTVGFVGTLKAWHGIETLIRATGRLAAVDSGWRLLVVGDGPMLATLQQLVAALSLRDVVEFTGAVRPGQVASQLHRMDVGCAPYPPLDRCYFSPLKIYEYLAAGLPVVASDVGQVPSAVGHGEWGRLVPAGDIAALAEALRAARDDFAWRVRMRQQARAAAVEHFTWNAIVDRTLSSVGAQRA